MNQVSQEITKLRTSIAWCPLLGLHLHPKGRMFVINDTFGWLGFPSKGVHA